MDDELMCHISKVMELYEPLIIGYGARIKGGDKLWEKFTKAVDGARQKGAKKFAGVIEFVNELAVARLLLADPEIMPDRIYYEPQIAADGSRIDFVVYASTEGVDPLYIEVKTVRPTAADSEENWQNYQCRKTRHPENVVYLVEQAYMGARIYGNAFSSRTKFLDYTRIFEDRLAKAQKVQLGRGLLLFCCNGLEWRLSDLEDFADFYQNGRHREDDPFAKMEAYEIQRKDMTLIRNIAAFGYMKRPVKSITGEPLKLDVRGPRRFR